MAQLNKRANLWPRPAIEHQPESSTSGYALDLDGTGFILREGLNFLQKPSKAEKILQTVQDLLGE